MTRAESGWVAVRYYTMNTNQCGSGLAPVCRFLGLCENPTSLTFFFFPIHDQLQSLYMNTACLLISHRLISRISVNSLRRPSLASAQPAETAPMMGGACPYPTPEIVAASRIDPFYITPEELKSNYQILRHQQAADISNADEQRSSLSLVTYWPRVG